jgi:MFS family permease
MIKEVFDYSLVAAVSCFIAFIVLSIIGSILEKRIRGETYEKAGKLMIIVFFALFLVFGFSIVPLAIGIFIPLLKQVVPIPIDFLEQNDMLIVYFFWAVYMIGLIIALPTMIKGGFFEPEKKQEARESGGKPPGLTWPPLDYQIKHAGAIMLARTEKKGESASYTVLEAWKRPQKDFPFKKGEPADITTRFFELQGYAPEDRQLVVFFFSNKPPYNELLELLPVIGSYVMYAPSDTTVQEYLGLGDLKKRVMQAGKQAQN